MGTKQSSLGRHTLLVVIPTAASACALSFQAPVEHASPSASPEGVEFEVIGQLCTPPQAPGPDEITDDRANVVLQIQVRDATAEPMVVHKDRFRLLTSAWSASRVWTWGLRDPLIIQSGETRSFNLRFEPDGDVECSEEMWLEAGSSILLHDKGVRLDPFRFVPGRN